MINSLIQDAKGVRVLLILIALLFGLLFSINISVVNNQQFSFLADSFINGRPYFLPEHTPFLTHIRDGVVVWPDISTWQNKNYWPLGPIPAVILMPFVFIFGYTLPVQGYISFALTILNFILIYKIANLLGHNYKSSLWLAMAFIFGTTYIGVATFPVSWYFAQVVGTTFILLAFNEYFKKDQTKWWLIGLYISLATATRLTLGLGVVFFLITLLQADRSNIKKNIIQITLPLLIMGLILAGYNYIRFDNVFESGYKLQTVNPAHQLAREKGMFSITHVPGNIYYLLFHGPQKITESPESSILKFPYIFASRWGMSIFFTSPIFIFLFLTIRKKLANKITQAVWITTFLMLIPILTYYGIGAAQYGYRYALDFIPFIFILLCLKLEPQLPQAAKFLILSSIFFNIYLLSYFKF